VLIKEETQATNTARASAVKTKLTPMLISRLKLRVSPRMTTGIKLKEQIRGSRQSPNAKRFLRRKETFPARGKANARNTGEKTMKLSAV
jgi:hypothetical protein